MPFLKESFSLLFERNLLVHLTARAEVLTNLFECRAKSRGGFEVSKSSHGVVALLYAAMILLQSIVEISVGSVYYVTAQSFSNSARVRVVSIAGYSFWWMANYIYCSLEELLCCFHISILAQHYIDQVAVTIYAAIEIAPTPLHFQISFIDIPGYASLPFSSGSEHIYD